MTLQLRFLKFILRIVNPGKIFVLQGNEFREAALECQKNVSVPKRKQFRDYTKTSFEIDRCRVDKFAKSDIVAGDLSRTVVVYLHGGGFVMPISVRHWSYLNYLSKHVNADFLVLHYPLAPAANCAQMLDFVSKTISNYARKYDKIVLMGDSAGAQLSLSYTQSKHFQNNPVNQVIAISPLVDASLSNPKIRDVEKEDVIMSLKSLEDICDMVIGEYQKTSKIISALYGDFSNIRTMVVSGTADIFNPDSKIFAAKHPTVEYIEHKGAPHIYPVFWWVREAKQVNREIIRQINSHLE